MNSDELAHNIAIAQQLKNHHELTAANAMYRATQYIDAHFGDDYARNHPELLAGFIMAMTVASAIDSASRRIDSEVNKTERMFDFLREHERKHGTTSTAR